MAASMGTPPAYELDGATRTYGQASTLVTALDSLDLTIRSGEFAAILGPSGSGKTTLLQLLGALDRPSGGTVRFEGHHLEGLGQRDLADLRLSAIGFVFQQFNLIPTLTAAENVEAGLAPLRMNGVGRGTSAAEHLATVGLEPRAGHLPTQLSGGEQQRVAIARALARSPRVVLADEPTGNLDSRAGDAVVELLYELNRNGSTIVVITHDREIADSLSRQIAVRDGLIETDSTRGVVR